MKLTTPPSNAEVKNGGAIPPLPHTSSWLDAKLSTWTILLFSFYFYLLLLK
jgi:hypothetical protein